MAKDKFDKYREALVMETETVWPEEFSGYESDAKTQIESGLHSNPEAVSMIEYVRTHSGFCRTVTVTQEDIDRIYG